ncbi:hypothetical protein VR010_08735 [Actinomycetaceae bacterium L2_0104]
MLLPLVILAWMILAAASLLLGWMAPAALAEATSITLGGTTHIHLSAGSTIGMITLITTILATLAGVAGVALQVLYGNATNSGPAWGVAHLLGIPLLGIGVGATASYYRAGEFHALTVILAAVGLLVVCLQGIARAFSARRARIRERTLSTGTRTVARVKRVDIVNYNSVDRWKIWLEYEDAGRNVWHITHVLPPAHIRGPQLGDRYDISYDPAKPGKKSHVVVHGQFQVAHAQRQTPRRSAHRPSGSTGRDGGPR